MVKKNKTLDSKIQVVACKGQLCAFDCQFSELEAM